MSQPPTPPVHRTALYQLHVALGARMVPFGGWAMPLQYTSILGEARAVRTAVGLFDVSHMGRLRFSGEGAVAFLNSVLPARVEALRPGQARYTFFLNQEGGIIDDAVVYRLPDSPHGAPESLMIVCNAANRETVLAWLRQWASPFPRLAIADTTLDTVMVAVQGPGAAAVLGPLCSPSPTALRPFAAAAGSITLEQRATPLLISRTGYTGEDGFELIASKGNGPALWRLLQEYGGTPCGLGARDTLRLEAGLSLHGNDIDFTTTPLEAGLERFVSLDTKEEFLGREALLRQRTLGLKRRLVGFILLDRGIPRHGYPILAEGKLVGSVTSGGYAPTLDRGIGLGYVPVEYAAPGTRLTLDLRGRQITAQVVAVPFYRRTHGQAGPHT